jgi:maleate isomerase
MAETVIRIGVVSPHAAIGPEAEFPAMAPGRVTTRVERVSVGAALVGVKADAPSPSRLRALTAYPILDEAAATLARDSVDVIAYASTSSAYAIGFDAEAAVALRLSRRVGIPVLATCASAVLALRVLGVRCIALVDPPWFDAELNELGATYFRNEGFDVVSSASADLPGDTRRIEAAAGLLEWTAQHVSDDVEAVFIGGNGFRAAGAIASLERAIGRPVLTSNQVLLWNLLAHAGATFEVSGYGELFAHDPRSSKAGLDSRDLEAERPNG